MSTPAMLMMATRRALMPHVFLLYGGLRRSVRFSALLFMPPYAAFVLRRYEGAAACAIDIAAAATTCKDAVAMFIPLRDIDAPDDF